MKPGRILVTGASGQLGGQIVADLRADHAVTGLDRRPGESDALICDLLDIDAVRQAARGHETIMHVGALANIWAGSHSEIVRSNVSSTWNILEAAEQEGVRRVILCSSDSVHGFTVRNDTMQAPDYLPADEEHPRRATDAYGLSKMLCEDLGQAFSRRGKLEVIILRPVFILYPAIYPEIRARAANPQGYEGPAGGGPGWHYVDPRDVSRAFRLAAELDAVTFETFLICGPSTLAPEPTLERYLKQFSALPEIRRPEVYAANGFAPLFDMAQARDRLGYWPTHDLRQLFYS